jgi:signal transduction histidine kinase
MTSARTTRRHAIIALAAVCALVLGGLGWATHSAVQLEGFEARAAQDRALEEQHRSFDQRQALALSRLDLLVQPILGREATRPFNHFRRYYIPTGVLNAADLTPSNEPVVLESPLHASPCPDWILLHFHTYRDGDREVWRSPQVEQGLLAAALPAGGLPASERSHRAKPENWLAELKFRYSPLDLQDELTKAVLARDNREVMRSSAAGASRIQAAPSLQGTRFSSALDDRNADFVSGGGRLLQMELEKEINQCVREPVRLENLEVDPESVETLYEDSACMPVWWTGMTPLWLDLSDDDEQQLAFMRSVSVDLGDGNAMCMLQGVLFNWRWLQSAMQDEVRDLFPEASVVPVQTGVGDRREMVTSMMALLPARLKVTEQTLAAAHTLSGGLKAGLLVAWLATVLALLAIAYGTVKYVTDAERRMRFSSAVTHELRTPLTSFQLYSDLLADMPEEDAGQRRQYSETLRAESKRLARLVENVLAYSRIGESEPTLHWQETAPQALLESVRAATADICDASGKDLVLENHCTDGTMVETDSQFAAQILTNLIENACKYSADAKDPRIWLTTALASHDSVMFEVDDAGRGVPHHDRRKVFQPFHRSGSGLARRTGGVGLGLALSRYWTTCLGGRLTLRRSPRNGSRYTSFALSLPIARSA